MYFAFLMIMLTTGVATAADVAKSMDEAIAQQRAAVAKMDASLSAQRAAVSRQRKETPADSFFLLAAPSRSTAPYSPAKENCDPVPPAEMETIIQHAARSQDLHPQLLRGVIKQESAFFPCAVSSKGALGLMQLMPATAAHFGVKDPFNPKENVEAGARLLKPLLDMYGNLPLALGAYNAGPGNVNQAGGIPDFQETKSYIRSILLGLPPDILIPKR